MILALLMVAMTLPEMPAGAIVERSDFQYTRPLGSVSKGLVSLALDSHVLLHSHALRDVRIVDATSRQIPYLVVPLPSPVRVSLAVPMAAHEGKRSVYRLALPDGTLPEGTELELTTSVSVFERDILLRRPLDESRGREAQVIDRLRWRSAPALRTSLTAGGAIELVVDEGDNAALPIVSASLRLPGFALRFVSTGSTLTLLYGNPSMASPRYDLALVSSQLLDQPARSMVLVGLPAEAPPAQHKESRVFGVAIGVAVVVLLIVLGRLVTAQKA